MSLSLNCSALVFLRITQYNMPFIDKSAATKRSQDRKINGKCTNATNRRSRVWPVYLIYHHCDNCFDRAPFYIVQDILALNQLQGA